MWGSSFREEYIYEHSLLVDRSYTTSRDRFYLRDAERYRRAREELEKLREMARARAVPRGRFLCPPAVRVADREDRRVHRAPTAPPRHAIASMRRKRLAVLAAYGTRS